MSPLSVVLRFPFTLLGVLSVSAFILLGVVGLPFGSSVGGRTIAAIALILIVPVWVLRTGSLALLVFLYGDSQAVPPLIAQITIPLLLLPYIAMDVILHHWLREPNPHPDDAS